MLPFLMAVELALAFPASTQAGMLVPPASACMSRRANMRTTFRIWRLFRAFEH